LDVKQFWNWVSARRWRLYFVLFLCAVLPLLLFLSAADRLLRRMEAQNLLQRGRPAAEPFARTLSDHFRDVRSALEGLATNPDLVESWDRSDWPAMTRELRQASELRTKAASFAVYDGDGILRAWYPKTKAPANSAPEPWLKTALATHKSYVSGVAPMPGSEMAVTVAVPIVGRHSSGVLAATYPVTAIQSWLENVQPSVTQWTSIIDQNGTIVTGAKLDSIPPDQVPNLEEVRKLMQGDAATEFIRRNGNQVLVSRLPVPSLGWGVLIEISSQEIDKTIWQLERPIAVLGLIFTVLALIFGFFTASMYGRLRESREHARQIVTASTDAYIAMDQTGRIADWNPQAEVLFGWGRMEVVGTSFAETIIPGISWQADRRRLARFDAPKHVELVAMDRYGREFPVQLSISHMVQRGKSFFSAFVHDISARKRAEEEIQQLNLQLRARVSDLEAKNRDLEAFSYSVSHDVRAPLRNIDGYSKLLVEDFGNEIGPGARECIDQIQKGTRRVQHLVEDLLRFSRLGEQGLQLRSTDLNEVVSELTTGMKNDLNGRNVEFEIASLPVVECDPGLVTQVFWNLLANAVKFSATREHPVVCVGELVKDGESILFVRDNGVGFDMKQADKLFGVFQRLHRQDEFEGSGVGLATVQRIILKHGGRIWAHSEPGQGASFFFVLPPRVTSANESSAPAASLKT
jgi:PAS domain S-box-containing protein